MWKCKRTFCVVAVAMSVNIPPTPQNPANKYKDDKHTEAEKNEDSTRPLNSADTRNFCQLFLANGNINIYICTTHVHVHLTHADPDMGRSPGFVVTKRVLPTQIEMMMSRCSRTLWAFNFHQRPYHYPKYPCRISRPNPS